MDSSPTPGRTSKNDLKSQQFRSANKIDIDCNKDRTASLGSLTGQAVEAIEAGPHERRAVGLQGELGLVVARRRLLARLQGAMVGVEEGLLQSWQRGRRRAVGRVGGRCSDSGHLIRLVLTEKQS
jgi:hypothetical protein